MSCLQILYVAWKSLVKFRFSTQVLLYIIFQMHLRKSRESCRQGTETPETYMQAQQTKNGYDVN